MRWGPHSWRITMVGCILRSGVEVVCLVSGEDLVIFLLWFGLKQAHPWHVSFSSCLFGASDAWLYPVGQTQVYLCRFCLWHVEVSPGLFWAAVASSAMAQWFSPKDIMQAAEWALARTVLHLLPSEGSPHFPAGSSGLKCHSSFFIMVFSLFLCAYYDLLMLTDGHSPLQNSSLSC